MKACVLPRAPVGFGHNFMYIFAYELHHARLEDLLIIIRPHLLQMGLDLRVISAYMLAIPPVTSTIVVRKGRLQSLQCQIGRAHNCLPHVVKAVNHMPVVILRQLNIALETRVNFDNSIQAVQLVRHGGSEDRLVLVPDDGCGQVVIQLWSLDVLEAHTDRDQLIPGGKRFGLEEVGGVVGREGLVDCECCDFGGDCIILV